MKTIFAAAVLFSIMLAAQGQGFPDSIGLCGEGTCVEVPIMFGPQGEPNGVGPVANTLPLGTEGGYPEMISFCGDGKCVTVCVFSMGVNGMAEAMEANLGVGAMGDWPASIGVCGHGMCRAVPVNVEGGVAVSVGPVDSCEDIGAPGAYPVDVGVCGLGMCVAVPVVCEGKAPCVCPAEDK